MTWRMVAIALMAVAIMSASPMFAQGKSHRVLFALTSPEETDWNITLHNIRNLIKGLAPDTAEIEVVAYGPGVVFLKSSNSEASEIKQLEAAHVRFLACGNAMQAMHLTQADLVSGTEIVPAGIVEVVKKQEEGWTYIKAGR
jgi:intracellular sulfur oxidation DsrE/DsrF family protein